jgi:protein SEY1
VTLHLIPVFAEVRLSSGTNPKLEIPPPPDYTVKSFFTLLSPTKQADLTTRFKRAADALYLEAKNSTISSISNIPSWFYILLLVLGWNELMAVLRNPIWIVLFAILAGGGYLVVQAGLIGPLMKIGNAVVEQSVDIARVLSPNIQVIDERIP